MQSNMLPMGVLWKMVYGLRKGLEYYDGNHGEKGESTKEKAIVYAQIGCANTKSIHYVT